MNKANPRSTFTRPANTTAYGVGDVVSGNGVVNPTAIGPIARGQGGSGYIVMAKLTTDKVSIVPAIRVHLFSSDEPTIAADNADFANAYADDADYIGYFDLPALASPGADLSTIFDDSLRFAYKCADDDVNLYFVLETLTAFTPDSGQEFALTLMTELDPA